MRSRMSTWFETKVRYTKAQEDGSEKPVTEAYVVDALSFTEAESRIIDEMAVYVTGEFKVSGISKAAYGEVFFSDMDGDDKWYKAKLSFITIDEKTEKEKRSNVNYHVQAKSLARALIFRLVSFSHSRVQNVCRRLWQEKGGSSCGSRFSFSAFSSSASL